jgi:hypothetical protein
VSMVVAMRATSQIGKSSADAWGRGSFCTRKSRRESGFPYFRHWQRGNFTTR